VARGAGGGGFHELEHELDIELVFQLDIEGQGFMASFGELAFAS